MAFDPISRPSPDAMEYIVASGAVAVYAATRLSDRHVLLGGGADPWLQCSIYPHGAEIWWMRWVYGTEAAKAALGTMAWRFAQTEAAALPTDLARMQKVIDISEPEIVGAPNDNVIARAGKAIALVDRIIEKMKAEGEMSAINREYRAARLAGHRVPPFPIYQKQYRIALIRKVAAEADARRTR